MDPELIHASERPAPTRPCARRRNRSSYTLEARQFEARGRLHSFSARSCRACCEPPELPIWRPAGDEPAGDDPWRRRGLCLFFGWCSLRYRPGHSGADDNASAVAVMLELAARLRQNDLELPASLPSPWKNRRHSRPVIKAAGSSSEPLGAMVTVSSVPSFWRWSATPPRASATHLSPVGPAIPLKETLSASSETGARENSVARL